MLNEAYIGKGEGAENIFACEDSSDPILWLIRAKPLCRVSFLATEYPFLPDGPIARALEEEGRGGKG